MELTVLLPMLSELLKEEGTFGHKLFMGLGFLIVIHLMGRNHIKLITTEMKSMKQEMVKGFESVHGELAVGKEVHARHESELDAHEKQINSLKMDVQKLQSHNIQRNA